MGLFSFSFTRHFLFVSFISGVPLSCKTSTYFFFRLSSSDEQRMFRPKVWSFCPATLWSEYGTVQSSRPDIQLSSRVVNSSVSLRAFRVFLVNHCNVRTKCAYHLMETTILAFCCFPSASLVAVTIRRH
uniref:Putative secreted protein n=1 Tax=Amblyomma triste TaxID=251400 RepID=A0A023G4J5_AMBTT